MIKNNVVVVYLCQLGEFIIEPLSIHMFDLVSQAALEHISSAAIC